MSKEDLEMQAAWMREELHYSHVKTHGYPEKLRRLKLPQSDPQSVLSFMNSYWDRFQLFNAHAEQTGNPQAVKQALQQLGKVPNELVDKVGLTLWLEDPLQDSYVDEAVDIVMQSIPVESQLVRNVYETYGNMLRVTKLEDTLIGLGIGFLHSIVELGDYEPMEITATAIDTARSGVLVWTAYLQQLREQGLEITMPRPGLPSGTIEAWERKTAR